MSVFRDLRVGALGLRPSGNPDPNPEIPKLIKAQDDHTSGLVFVRVSGFEGWSIRLGTVG